ncbi:MAG: beta strand repeat-containing protein, partial [Limisphaerales bacterium]
TWIGGPSDYWDVYSSSNWENGGTQYSFLPGDMVTFNDAGGTNTNVDIDATVSPASITVASANDYTFSGDGDIEGSTGLFKTNSGVLTILTTNSYKGPTIVDGGTLAVSNLELSGVDSPIGAGPNSADNVVFNGSTLDFLGAAATTDHGMTLNSGGATVEVANAGADLTLSGILTGAGELTIPGPGLLTLSGASTYSGGTFLDAATVEPDNASCFGTGEVTNNNGVMLFDIFPNGGVIPNIMTVEGTNTINCGNNSGGMVLGGALVGSGTVDVTNLVSGATLTFGESGGGGGNLSAFTGSIVVTDPNSAGNVRFNNGGGNNNSGNSAMTMDLGQSSVTFYSRNNGAPVNFGALAGGPFTVIKQGSSSSGTSTYTIGGLNTNCTYSGKIADGGVGSGAYLSLVKVGTGTLTLNGGSTLTTNTTIVGIIPVTTIGYQADMLAYTGPTTVSNGVLALDAPAQLTNSDRVTLASPNAVLDATEMGYVSNLSYTLDNGATQEVIIDSTYEVVTNQILAGVGTLKGILQADPGSTFNVGLPTGAFNVTSSASLSGAIVMSLDGSSSSELIANGINIGSTASLLVTNVGTGLANGATFTLFNGPVSGFASVTLPATDPTGTTNYAWADNLDKNGTITLTSGGVIPAPPAIHFSLSGRTLTLSWSAADLGDTLQMQTNSISVGL